MSDNSIFVSAPYRFVPLAPFVVVPEWGKFVSHDHPFEDGVSGELNIKITAKTPICVGGEQSAATATQAGKVHFNRTIEGDFAIPGSSIKGMLRNVLEIATFSRFSQVEDQHLSIREIKKKDKNESSKTVTYMKYMFDNPSKSGWLNFKNGQWTITPCNFTRVHQQKIIDFYNIPFAEWDSDELKTASSRYKKFKACAPKVSFNYIEGTEYIKQLADLVPKGVQAEAQGYLVVTGQPGANFTTKHGKKYEFIFHSTQPEESALPIPSFVKLGFDQIYQDSTDWAYFKKLMNTPQLESPGVPVFYHEKNREIESFGLSKMYRLPFKITLHDAIKNSSEAHLTKDFPDLADLMFGFLDGENSEFSGLRGRVSFNTAIAKTAFNSRMNKETILNGPKPSFYPAYIEQDRNEYISMLNEKAKLTGWKRYPIKELDIPTINGKSANNKKVQVQLESLPEDSQFDHTIRFHNLRRVELGALLWAIDFGGDTTCFHGIGMGRPLGFGAVQLAITQSKLRANSLNEISDNDYLNVCRKEFIEYMEKAISILSPKSTWTSSPSIKALKTFAKFKATEKDGMDPFGLRYLDDPKEFATLKEYQYLQSIKETFHHFGKMETIAPTEKSDNYPQVNYLGNLAQVLEAVKQDNQILEAQQAKLAAKEATLAEISQATPQKAILLKIQVVFNDWEANPNKTKEKDIEAELRSAEKAITEFNDEELAELKLLVNQCADINKPISKIAKRINQYTAS